MQVILTIDEQILLSIKLKHEVYYENEKFSFPFASGVLSFKLIFQFMDF